MASSPNLSPSAQMIQAALRDAGFPNRVIEYSESTRTAQEAADRVGCSLGQIVKSLVFRGAKSGKAVLILTSGANRVNEIQIGDYLGEEIIRADAEFVRLKTGFSIGGVPPLGHREIIETFLDMDLFQFDSIWAAAGTPNAVFELTPADLQKMTGGKVVKVN